MMLISSFRLKNETRGETQRELEKSGGPTKQTAFTLHNIDTIIFSLDLLSGFVV